MSKQEARNTTDSHKDTEQRSTTAKNISRLFSSDFDSTEDIVSILSEQETKDPLNEENCTDGGRHKFAVRKTSLPQIEAWKDLEEGMLIYNPTTSPYAVYEIIDPTPIDGEYFDTIKVIRHSRSHTGTDPTYQSQITLLFQQQITQQMTYLQDPQPQSSLTDY
jgi:hypothetical protein